MLKRKGVPHQVLNAKYHEMEAAIVSQAGRYKAVTIATNMAGRGPIYCWEAMPILLLEHIKTEGH